MSVKKLSLVITHFFNLDILEVLSPTSFKVQTKNEEVFVLNIIEKPTYVNFYNEEQLIGTHFK